MRHENILVLGGTGFVGRCLVDLLVAQGRRVCVPTRRLAHARPLLVLPTIEVVEAELADPGTLSALLAGRDAVINLVGVLHDSGGAAAGASRRYRAGFAAAHVELPARLVRACQAQGVGRLLHVSALGADPQGPSAYLRSKGDGERRVLDAASIAATVFRPSVVFGAGDSFLNLFAHLAAVLPVLAIGRPQARMQPVFVRDFAQAVAGALDTSATAGKTYEICGPTIYTLRELVHFAAQASGHPRPVVGLPDALATLLAFALELLPGEAPLTRDNLRSLTVDNVASVQPYRPASEIAFQPTPLEPEAALYLAGLHPRTRFGGFRARAGRT